MDNIKKDWITIEIDHERYSFDTNIGLWRNMTLDELLNEFGYLHYKDKLEQSNDGFRYTLDFSVWSELDTKYQYPELKELPLQHIHLDTLLIVEFDKFIEEEGASFIWGQTENKFGLIDIKRK